MGLSVWQYQGDPEPDPSASPRPTGPATKHRHSRQVYNERDGTLYCESCQSWILERPIDSAAVLAASLNRLLPQQPGIYTLAERLRDDLEAQYRLTPKDRGPT